jgi:hypothetical protein
VQKAWKFRRAGHTIVGKVTYMGEDPHNIISCAQILFFIKNLEKVGDHAIPLSITRARTARRIPPRTKCRLRDAKCNADPGE